MMASRGLRGKKDTAAALIMRSVDSPVRISTTSVLKAPFANAISVPELDHEARDKGLTLCVLSLSPSISPASR